MYWPQRLRVLGSGRAYGLRSLHVSGTCVGFRVWRLGSRLAGFVFVVWGGRFSRFQF